MNRSSPGKGEAARDGRRKRLPDWAAGLLVTEAVAFLIALVTPVTPSKTGSTWSPAEIFWTDPGYLREVAADFVFVNLLILVLGLITWLLVVRGRAG